MNMGTVQYQTMNYCCTYTQKTSSYMRAVEHSVILQRIGYVFYGSPRLCATNTYLYTI